MLALVFSVWKDMGDGVTPLSPQWENHMTPLRLNQISPYFEMGSIRSRFEDSVSDSRKKLDWKEFYVEASERDFLYGESCGHLNTYLY